MAARVFLIGADSSFTRPLVRALDSAGYRVRVQGSPTDADVVADLVLLSLESLSVERIASCRSLAGFAHKPMLVWLERAGDVAAALRAGADDCVVGAGDFSEVLARIEALLRRSRQDGHTGVLCLDGVRVDLRRGRADLGRGAVSLTPKELHLITYLAAHEGFVIPRDELLREVWGYAATDTRTVDTHMSALRRKLEANPRRPEHLFTVRGRGYQFRQ